MTIVQKIILWFLALSLVPILVVGGIVYADFSEVTERDLTEHLSATADTQQHRIEDVIGQNGDRLKALTSNQLLGTTIDRYNNSSNANDRNLITAYLNGVKTQFPSFKDITVLNQSGNVVASTNTSEIGMNHASENYFKYGLMQSDVTSYFFKDSPTKLMLDLSGPMKLGQKTVGVVVVSSDTQNITSITNDYSGLGLSGETILVRQTSADTVYLTPLRFNSAAVLQSADGAAGKQNLVDQAFIGGTSVITNGWDYRNQPVVATARQIKGVQDWRLIVKIDQTEAYGAIYEVRDTTLLLVFITLVLAVFAALFATRFITEPILALSEAASEMSKGKLEHRVVINSEDEIGALGSAFNIMADSLDKLDQMKTEFISLTSHQLRTPATAVKGFIDMLLSGYAKEVNPQQRKLLLSANDENERQLHLINDILAIARADDSKIQISKIETNITNVIQSVIRQQMPILETHDQKLIFDSSQPIKIHADAEKIRIVLENLISNASKYSPDHTEIKVFVTQGEKNTKLEVADQGFGISPNDMKKLFQKFSRLPNPNMVKAQGSGLGLYLVKKIIELHDGSIDVESDGSTGTKFIVQLPNK